MKVIAWLLASCIVIPCCAQERCPSATLTQGAAQVKALRSQLTQAKLEDGDTDVPAPVADHLQQLKDALARVSDAALGCASQAVEPTQLETTLAETLQANPPEPGDNQVISKDDHRFDEVLGAYGHNLRVHVSRLHEPADLLEIEYSVNVECGSDTMLLIYELQHGVWKQRLRWQAPRLKSTGDAFGDFFLSAILPGSSSAGWRLVAVHGRPWCTSRFSGFGIDVLAPSAAPGTPRIIWHTERGYSRGDFGPKLKIAANIFELRLNAPTLDVDGYERRIIYRYRVDEKDQVQRLGPLGINARGFVEEWLSAPWLESRGLSAADSAADLEQVHREFEKSSKLDDNQSITYSYGPVRACKQSGVFQVQINRTLQIIVPGKPGGDSKPLPGRYFHVRELKDGYEMLSAPDKPDTACAGGNLMPAGS